MLPPDGLLAHGARNLRGCAIPGTSACVSFVEELDGPANAPPELPGGHRVDFVFEKNAKGDLTRRLVDGDRLLLVQECHNAPDPMVDSPIDEGCTTPDEIFYVYEPTGEISTLHDALAASDPAIGFSDPDHFLRHRCDTLGQVIEIEDPDLEGTGSTLTRYASRSLPLAS